MKGFAVLLVALVASVSSTPVGPCEKHGQLMADLEHCDIFYECSFGYPFLFHCQAGLEYNPEMHYCDYPKPGGCHARMQKRDVPTCPSELGEFVVQYPNDEDCGSFYKCNDKGQAVLIKCPSGLEYNADEQVCDYPYHAHCEYNKK